MASKPGLHKRLRLFDPASDYAGTMCTICCKMETFSATIIKSKLINELRMLVRTNYFGLIGSSACTEHPMKNRLAPASIGRASLHSFDCGPRMSQDGDDDEAIKISHKGMMLEILGNLRIC